jgi:phage gp29-like protein
VWWHTATKRASDGIRKLGSLLPRRRGPGGDERQIVRPWREDAFHAYPSVGLTPSRVLAILHAADAGSPQLQFELFGEMLQKWPRLAAVEATRRLALTGLDWEIEPGAAPAADARATDRAHEAAEYCRLTLASIERLDTALDHLANAIGYGIAAAELVWDAGRLVDVVPVPHTRLAADANEPWRLRVRTEEDPGVGVALDEYAAKWIVHQPRAKVGRHFAGGLLRASALMYVAQNLSFKDWLIYSQIAGMPVRVGRFEPGTPEADKQHLLKMLEALGTDAVAILSKSVELQMIESRGGDKPYQPLQDYCNNEITILWLGQHLTTDLRDHGSRAAAEIHDRVREDLLVNDIADESRTIRRDLLTPLVRARFGDGVAIPHLRRSLIQSVDTKVLADTLAVAVRQLGLRVPTRWVHRALGVPEPNDGEPVLTGSSPS